MANYDRPYKIYYIDQKNKLKISDAERIEVENGFVAIYGVSDPSVPKRIVPMHRVAEIYRNYPDEGE